jgi:hypothetical protein
MGVEVLVEVAVATAGVLVGGEGGVSVGDGIGVLVGWDVAVGEGVAEGVSSRTGTTLSSGWVVSVTTRLMAVLVGGADSVAAISS